MRLGYLLAAAAAFLLMVFIINYANYKMASDHAKYVRAHPVAPQTAPVVIH